MSYSCHRTAHNLNWYRFIGRILGKALYEGILVDVAFAGFFLAKVRFRTPFVIFHELVLTRDLCGIVF